MKDTKETQNFFPTQGKTIDHKGDTYSQQEGTQGQRSRERERSKRQKSKTTKEANSGKKQDSCQQQDMQA